MSKLVQLTSTLLIKVMWVNEFDKEKGNGVPLNWVVVYLYVAVQLRIQKLLS